jgi:hypothetical protein
MLPPPPPPPLLLARALLLVGLALLGVPLLRLLMTSTPDP